MGLVWLNGTVNSGAGDVAGGADYAPTDASLEWLAGIEKRLDAAKGAYKSLVDTDLVDFNKAMEGKIPPVTETVRPIVP